MSAQKASQIGQLAGSGFLFEARKKEKVPSNAHTIQGDWGCSILPSLVGVV